MKLLIILCILFSFQSVQAEENDIQPAKPVSFQDFTTPDMKKADGTFPVYQKEGRIYMEFPRQYDGREIEIGGQIDEGFGLTGRPVKSLGVVCLTIANSQTVEFRQPFYAERIMDPNCNYWEAFKSSNAPVAGEVYPAVAISQKGNPIIDITDVIKGAKKWISYPQYQDIRTISPEMSSILDVEAIPAAKAPQPFDGGMMLRMLRYHEAEGDQYAFNSMAIILPNGKKPLRLSLYLRLLPREGMPIRMAARDMKVQTIHFTDYSQNPYKAVDDSLVVRLNPQYPCKVYIDSLVPERYVEALQNGILAWNGILAKAKVKMRIQVSRIVKGSAPIYAPMLVSYDMGKKGVSSEKTVHPRTGEVLSCHINVGHDFKQPVTPAELQKQVQREFGAILGLVADTVETDRTSALTYLYCAPKSSQIYKDRELCQPYLPASKSVAVKKKKNIKV